MIFIKREIAINERIHPSLLLLYDKQCYFSLRRVYTITNLLITIREGTTTCALQYCASIVCFVSQDFCASLCSYCFWCWHYRAPS